MEEVWCRKSLPARATPTAAGNRSSIKKYEAEAEDGETVSYDQRRGAEEDIYQPQRGGGRRKTESEEKKGRR